MAGARMVTLLNGEMPAKVGLLADVSEALGNAGVNLSGILAYEEDGKGYFTIVASDAVAAKSALEALGASVTEDTGIAVDVQDHPGSLAVASRGVASAGINVEYVWATTCGCEDCDCTATIVLKTSDDAGALAALGG